MTPVPPKAWSARLRREHEERQAAKAPVTADVQRELAEVTLTHRQRSSSPDGIECACGWVGPWFSRHQAEALAPAVQRLIAAAEKRAAAAALRDAADWLEDEDDDGGAPLTTSMGQVLVADREAAFANVVWAAQSLRDRAALDPAGAASGEIT